MFAVIVCRWVAPLEKFSEGVVAQDVARTLPEVASYVNALPEIKLVAAGVVHHEPVRVRTQPVRLIFAYCEDVIADNQRMHFADTIIYGAFAEKTLSGNYVEGIPPRYGCQQHN